MRNILAIDDELTIICEDEVAVRANDGRVWNELAVRSSKIHICDYHMTAHLETVHASGRINIELLLSS